MSDFFNSLKSDLLDRRFLPVLALLGVALLAAIAYAALGGSSTSTPLPVSNTPAAGTSAAIAISQAPTTNQAVAETTSGASTQHSGKARNPFTPLPSAKAKSSSASASSSTTPAAGSSSPASGSAKSTANGGGTAPAATPKPSAPAKPRFYIHFHVTAQFGVVPALVPGSPAQPTQLKTYPDMALNEPLPGKEPQLVYLGVELSTGKDAAFALTGEAILHGGATCKPSPTQCQAIVLAPGQSETLEVVSATGQATTYELKLLSITKSVSSSASAAHVHTARARAAGAHARVESKAGRALLERTGLATLSESYSTEKGFVRSGK